MARLWEDGETLVVMVDLLERPYYMESNPGVYFLTDHYRNYPAMLIRLPVIDPAELQERLIDAWCVAAPAKMASALITELENRSKSTHDRIVGEE